MNLLKALSAVLFIAPGAHASDAFADDGSLGAIAEYLDRSASSFEVEVIVRRYNRSDASVPKELQKLFDAAYEEAGDSRATKDALDSHWLTLNRCFSTPGRASRFEKGRMHSECGADLSAEKARVELALRRAASGS